MRPNTERRRGLTAAVVMILAAMLAGAASCEADSPKPPTASSNASDGPIFKEPVRVHAFADTTNYDSKVKGVLASLPYASRSVTDLHVTVVDCLEPADFAGGTFGWHEHVVQEIDDAARSRGMRLAPRVNCQKIKQLEKILFTDARRVWVDKIVEIGRRYDGVVIDFEVERNFADEAEAKRYREAFLAFTKEIESKLTRETGDHYLMVTVAVTTVYDRGNASLAPSALFDLKFLPGIVYVMAYRKSNGRSDETGALNPIVYVRRVIEHVGGMRDPQRTVLGMPLYAVGWAEDGEGSVLVAEEVAALKRDHDDAIETESSVGTRRLDYKDFGGVSHRVYYMNGHDARVRARLAADEGWGGIGFWTLRQEDAKTFWVELGQVNPVKR
jgi:spore germination protein YaaH